MNKGESELWRSIGETPKTNNNISNDKTEKDNPMIQSNNSIATTDCEYQQSAPPPIHHPNPYYWDMPSASEKISKKGGKKKKQRPFSRRGAAGHSEILKSAVLASLSYESEDDQNMQQSICSDANMSEISSSDRHSLDGSVSGSRKRGRALELEEGDDETTAVVEEASDLLRSMCFGKNHGRHVVRRTSRVDDDSSMQEDTPSFSQYSNEKSAFLHDGTSSPY